LNTGAVVDLDGVSNVSFTEALGIGYTISDFIVVRHRNHLAVMSAAAVGLPNEAATYDFTTAQLQAYGVGLPMFDLGGSVFAMYSGDANASGGVTSADRNSFWRPQNGTSGYLSGDFNLSGGVTSSDRNSQWRVNNGKGTLVP
jgi:hypothetical protein